MKTQMVLRAQVSKTRFAAPVGSENAKQMVVSGGGSPFARDAHLRFAATGGDALSTVLL